MPGTLLPSLLNPAEVVDSGAAPRFGEVVLLRLEAPATDARGGLGIRAMAYSPGHEGTLIVAGPHDARPGFAMFLWSGASDDPPRLLTRATDRINAIDGFAPEAIVTFPGEEKVLLLGDDGSRWLDVRGPSDCTDGSFGDGRCQAKHLLDESKKRFRGLWVEVG